MSRLFYAVNRETGERWKPATDNPEFYAGTDVERQYLMAYDSGEVVIAEEYYWGEVNIGYPLCNKTWKVVFNSSMQSKIDKSGES